MKLIELTKGFCTQVDNVDYEWLIGWKWRTLTLKNTSYAVRHDTDKETGANVIILIHRVITGAPKGYDADHKNRDGLDNQRENLRVCTRSQNLGNMRIRYEMKRHSQYKGVSYDSRNMNNRWYAYINCESRRHFLGYFATEEEAARAYNAKALELFGEFARLNEL